jgi:diaminopimelate epimerase
MLLRFTKMHGQGNDFVMLNAVAQPQASSISAAQIRMIADRHLGIGCDQVLLAERATHPEADFRYRIFNADGGEVEHCGNGARCFPVFVRDEGLTSKSSLVVETMRGLIRPEINSDGSVSVDMGAPKFAPEDIPFIGAAEGIYQQISVNGALYKIGIVSMGNPHAVQVVSDVANAPVALEGPRIEHHPQFPKRVNAGFMQVIDRNTIRLRVWERGAGETLACGTGACAAVVTGIRWGLLNHHVCVHTQGGELSVTWQADTPHSLQPVIMQGVATIVYHGEIVIQP